MSVFKAGAAHGFERYAFGMEFVLDSQSWQEAEEKIARHLARRKKHSSEALSYYSEGGKVLWREYQLLFMCQYLEFRTPELIGRIHAAGCVKREFILKLQQEPRANKERAKEPHRLTSPASLLVDFGFTLGRLVDTVAQQTLSFDSRDELVAQLRSFNDRRKAFIHHSFSAQKKSGAEPTVRLVTEALECGNRALLMLQNINIGDGVKTN